MEAPESLRDMIELQIEKLSANEQRVLELASTGISFMANANDLGTTLDQEKFENTCEDLRAGSIWCGGWDGAGFQMGPFGSVTSLSMHCIVKFSIGGGHRADGRESASKKRRHTPF